MASRMGLFKRRLGTDSRRHEAVEQRHDVGLGDATLDSAGARRTLLRLWASDTDSTRRGAARTHDDSH